MCREEGWMMATIHEIAKIAGVSSALVSRVLNDKPGVSPENRRKILAVIKETRYVPNALARSLVRQSTQVIGVVMDDLCEKYFFDLIKGLQDMGEEQGYNVVFCSGRSRMDIKLRYVDYFTEGRADGLIAFGSRIEDAVLIRHILKRSPHFVLIEGDVPGASINRVSLNNTGGAYRATMHLIEKGYRHICHFTGDMNYNVSKERLAGFQSAMQDAGLSIDEDTVIYADFEEDLACLKMTELIRAGKAPEACFAGADRTAYGVMRAALNHGLKLPEDLAVIGFDDEPPDSKDLLFPGLTTLRQPLYEMGQTAVRLLVRSMQNTDAAPQTVVFEPEMILRDTCT